MIFKTFFHTEFSSYFYFYTEKPFDELKSKSEKKAKLYYMSCMDANETIEALGAKPMLDLLKEVGGWSIAGPFNIENWNLQQSLQVILNHFYNIY